MIVYLFRDYLQEYFAVGTNNTTASSLFILERWRLQHLPLFVVLSVSVSFLMFWGMGGAWQWYYYINRRHKVCSERNK